MASIHKEVHFEAEICEHLAEQSERFAAQRAQFFRLRDQRGLDH
jgi:hypothetical protein